MIDGGVEADTDDAADDVACDTCDDDYCAYYDAADVATDDTDDGVEVVGGADDA